MLDNLNRLTSAYQYATDGGTLEARVEYQYDALGNRSQKSVAPGVGPAVLNRFAYDDGGNAWADLDGNDQLLTRRLYTDAVDGLFARIAADGTAAWYLTDHEGSVRALADASGAVQDRRTYDGFGNITAETNAAFGDRYGWTGREFDGETGRQYNRARYYDPKAGRWTSEDPLGLGAGDPNLYRYAGNSAPNATDPTQADGLEFPLERREQGQELRPLPAPVGLAR